MLENKGVLPENFDWKFYLEYYEDLRNAGLETKEDAEKHYLNHGHTEGRIYKNFKPELNENYLKNIEEFKKKYNDYGVNIDDPKIEFRYFCFRYLNLIRKYEIPKIKKNKKLESVIVETRELPHIEFIIRNNIIKLGEEWSHTVICGNNNYEFMFNMCKNISTEIKIIKLDFDEITIPKYSELLSGIYFWDLLYGDKILIYQEDSIIFKKNIKDFLHFDYIGAPWDSLKFNNECVGNGGFSLRTKSLMKSIINKVENNKTDLSHLPNRERDIIKNHCLEKGYLNNLIPEDLYFTINMYQLGLGTLPTKKEAEEFSTESINNLNSFGGHNFWLSDINWKDRIYSNSLKQFNCDLYPNQFIEHRGGWSSIISRLIEHDFHNKNSKIKFYDIIEHKFLWEKNYISKDKWVGVMHSTPKTPSYINELNKHEFVGYLGIDEVFKNENFIKSLDKCKIIFVLSEYVKKYLLNKLKPINPSIKVVSLKHPVIMDGIKKFDYDCYKKNEYKKIVFIGRQLRKIHSYYLINTFNHKKIWLTGTKNFSHIKNILNEELKFYNLNNKFKFEDVNPTYLTNFDDYDEVLSKNLVFLDLYDASANNTVLECIVRCTPLIVKKLPAIIEYLGEDYPLYFDNLTELHDLINEKNIIKAHHYLKNICKNVFDIDHFINEINRIVYNEM
jgi:hypothetical protein